MALGLWLSPTAGAATIPVNIAADTPANDTVCSLREAINSAQANTPNPVDGCVDGEGAVADVITLKAGTNVYPLVGGSGEDLNAGGDLDIRPPTGSDPGLTIRGDAGAGGPADRIDAVSGDRVIDVLTSMPVTLDTVGIQNGLTAANGGGIRASSTAAVTVKDSDVTGNNAGADGGGIYSAGQLSVLRSRIGDNTASEAAADAPPDSFEGGGIAINVATGTQTIRDSTIIDNEAIAKQGDDLAAGGGINIDGGVSVEIIGTTITGNLVVAYDPGTLAGSPGPGGAGINQEGFTTLGVLNSTVTGNSTSGPGPDSGGALQTFTSDTATLVHVTISNNTSDGTDGIAGPLSTTLTLRGSIVDEGGEGCSHEADTHSYNVDGGGSCVGTMTFPIDLSTTNPLLLTPDANGGPTDTQALQPASPAIDHEPAASCKDLHGNPLLVDQRGAERPFNGFCDDGAYERVTCADSLPIILGGPGNDVLTGDGGANVIVGSGGDDTIDGGPGSDKLCGSSGNDTLLAVDSGPDHLDCGPGLDSFSADNALDTIVSCEIDLNAPPSAPAQPTSPSATTTRSPKCKKKKRHKRAATSAKKKRCKKKKRR